MWPGSIAVEVSGSAFCILSTELLPVARACEERYVPLRAISSVQSLRYYICNYHRPRSEGVHFITTENDTEQYMLFRRPRESALLLKSLHSSTSKAYM